jgi:hypothetical protein
LIAEISVKPAGDYIEVTIRDDNDRSVCVQADRHQSFAMIVSIVQALGSLPLDRKAPILGQQPVLTSNDPSSLFDAGTVFQGREIALQIDSCIVGVEKTLDLFKRVIANMPAGISLP